MRRWSGVLALAVTVPAVATSWTHPPTIASAASRPSAESGGAAPRAANVPPEANPPESTPESPELATGILDSLSADPEFIDPSVEDRLTILRLLILSYLDADDIRRGRRDDIQTSKGLVVRHAVALPTIEQLRSWFDGLTPRQRVAIDWKFNARARYLEVVREAAHRRRSTGKFDWGSPMGGSKVSMFADIDDVFLSQRDGQPFVIGATTIPCGNDGRRCQIEVIAREVKGVESLDLRHLEKQREVLGIAMDGQIVRYCEDN